MLKLPVESKLTKYLYAKASRAGIPLSGTFELTPCCNMACKMCYVRKTKQEQEAIAPLHTAEEWIELGRRAKENGMLYLLITGGEPFLRADFRKILTGLHELGLVISINTNATLIDEAVIEWLKETPPVRVNVTLYGASDDTYARLCGNPKGFSQAVKAIRLLRNAGIFVKINYSMVPDNASDLDGIMEFVEKEQLVIQATSYMFPPIRREKTMIGKNERFTPEEAAYHSARIACLVNGEEKFLEYVQDKYGQEQWLEIEECMEVEEGDGIRCRAGKSSFWITWQGNMLPCGMIADEGYGNVFESSFEDVWKNTHEIAQGIRLPVKCKSCVHREECKVCAARVIAESGNYHEVPEYHCQMTKSFRAACLRLEKEIIGKRGSVNGKEI